MARIVPYECPRPFPVGRLSLGAPYPFAFCAVRSRNRWRVTMKRS